MNNNWPLQSEGYSNPIKFLKTREVKSPSRANQYDAGIDFYIPEFTPQFIEDFKAKNPDILIQPVSIVLTPGQRALIPSGIHCQMASPHRALIAANKSGVATKHGLIFGAQVVDYEYQGEIHISLINTNKDTHHSGKGIVEITPGMKAIQFLEMPIFNSEILISETLSVETFYKTSTTRGADGFGSSDKK
jgi:dUTP pyrophosphatase